MKRRLLRVALIIVGLALALALVAVVAFRLANYTNGSIVSGGVERQYLLYVPKSYDPTVPAPLVITIHGFAQWPAHQAQLSRWNDLADREGFIVVYPAGTQFPMRWQAGGRLAGAPAPQPDVTFISDLIDKLEQEYNIDPARIYANGLSNGGGMSFVLSCQLPDRIAAVGLVAGAYVYPWDECRPARPVPAVVFHGTDDPIVPFLGGATNSFNVPFPVITEWVAALAQRNGCAATPRPLPAHGDVTGVQYADCAADVVFYTITGGGHTWPGGEDLPGVIAGRTSHDIDATQVMWDFFVEHPLPAR